MALPKPLQRLPAPALAGLCLALVAAPLCLGDWSVRGGHFRQVLAQAPGVYVASLLSSAVVWVGLRAWAVGVSGVRKALPMFSGLAFGTLAFGGQSYFYALYATYMNRDAASFGAQFGATIFQEMRRDWWLLVRVHGEALLICLGVWWALGQLLSAHKGLSRYLRWALPLGLLGWMVAPCPDRGAQTAAPDHIYSHAFARLVSLQISPSKEPARLPGERIPDKVPSLRPVPAGNGKPRNLLFILTESVRSDAFCSAYSPDCKLSRASNKVLPKRLPLMQLRSNDSATAVSVAVLFGGVPSVANREDMHRAPTLWEYAKSAGYFTAYWTAQHPKFGHSGLFLRNLPLDLKVNAVDLTPDADLDLGADDQLLSNHVISELGKLKEPFVAVVHYSNTHFPYWADKDDAPHQPAERTKDPKKYRQFWNFYLNAIHRQDVGMAKLLEATKKMPWAARTVTLFTSDHGEGFREHGQYGHTGSIYDEEIHVPGFVAAPPGLLRPEELSALNAYRQTPSYHTDMLPTMLDIIGVWSNPALFPLRKRMVGRSLLRTPRPRPPVAITNCASVWGCPFENWGMMSGMLKLEARAWDHQWHCFDLRADPKERHSLPPSACGLLPARALQVYGRRPGTKSRASKSKKNGSGSKH